MNHENENLFPPYVSRPVVNGEDLAAWAQELGLNEVLAPDAMHVTILYSQTPVDTAAIPLQTDTISVTLRRAVPFRISSALGVPIEHSSLNETHDRYLEIDATHDYADGVFRPHITLKYDTTEEDLARFTGSRGFTGCLKLGAERIKPLRSGWRP